MLFHPETVTLSSTGPASQKHVTSMGVYKITNMTHSGKPVWLSTIRDDRYLFYNGTHNNIIRLSHYYLTFSRWCFTLGCK